MMREILYAFGGLLFIGYALYELDRPWLTLAIGIVLILVALPNPTKPGPE